MHKTKIEKLIAAGQLGQALEAMLEALPANSALRNEVLHQLGRFNQVKSEQNAGTISPGEYQLTTAKIQQAALSLLARLPDGPAEGSTPAMPPPSPPHAEAPEQGQTPPQPTSPVPPFRWGWLVGLGLVLLLLALVVFIPCPSEGQYIVFRLVLALGLAALAAIVPGILQVAWNSAIKASGALAVFVVAYLMDPAARVGQGRCEQGAFSVTVFTKPLREGVDLPSPGGEVVLRLRSNERREKVNERGEATFKEIAAEFEGQRVPLAFAHPQGYKAAVGMDSVLLTRNGAYNLSITLPGTRRILGAVYDFQRNQPLDSVYVGINKQTFTYTDAVGEFILDIPEEFQGKFQRLKFLKKGYELLELDSVPVHTGQKQQVSLKKLKSTPR
jgi:hypothetical protein